MPGIIATHHWRWGKRIGVTFQEAVLATSPTAYWPMDEASGDIADATGGGLTLVANGTPTYGVAGWSGDAMDFDGSTDNLRHDDDDAFDFGTSDFSLMWVMEHASGWPASHEYVMGHDDGGAVGEWAVKMRGSASDDLRLSLHGNDYESITSADELDDAAFHICFLTADRSANATLYVDSSTNTYTVDISADVASDLTCARPFWVGDIEDGGAQAYTGGLQHVGIWKSTLLSASTIATMIAAR